MSKQVRAETLKAELAQGEAQRRSMNPEESPGERNSLLQRRQGVWSEKHKKQMHAGS